MNIGVISVRYARALLAFAKSRGTEDRVYDETKRLVHTSLNVVPQLRHTIENPVLSIATKHKLLCDAVGVEEVSEELKRFFRLVLEEKREKFLQFMIWSYIDLYREDKHILVGKLTTAVESPKLVKKLEELASARTNGTVELETKVDPSIIGGYIIELAGFRLDASVQNQLKRIRRQFIARNRRIV